MDDNLDEISSEMRAMKWKWTPELLELRQRGWDTDFNYHPDLGRNLNEEFDYKYSPSLPLPAYNDKRGMMRFCGLNDKVIDRLLEEYNCKYWEDLPPDFEIEVYTNGHTGTEFPVLDRLVDLFTHRDEGDLFDYEESYGQCNLDHPSPLTGQFTDFRGWAEGYIKKGLQQGLRPEFAIWWCELHELDTREKAKKFSAFTPPLPNWYKHSPMYYVDEIFKRNWARLSILWGEKLRADGIVKQSEHGDVLVEDSDRGSEPDGARADFHKDTIKV